MLHCCTCSKKGFSKIHSLIVSGGCLVARPTTQFQQMVDLNAAAINKSQSSRLHPFGNLRSRAVLEGSVGNLRSSADCMEGVPAFEPRPECFGFRGGQVCEKAARFLQGEWSALRIVSGQKTTGLFFWIVEIETKKHIESCRRINLKICCIAAPAPKKDFQKFIRWLSQVDVWSLGQRLNFSKWWTWTPQQSTSHNLQGCILLETFGAEQCWKAVLETFGAVQIAWKVCRRLNRGQSALASEEGRFVRRRHDFCRGNEVL